MAIIGLTADIHLHEHPAYARSVNGVNSRLLDCAEAFKAVVTKTKEAGGSLVIVAGDWHHSRKQIRVPVLDVGADALDFAKTKGVDVILVLGNHDMSLDGLSNSVDGLRFTDVITDPCVRKIAGNKIGFLPWRDAPEAVAAAYDLFTDENVDFVVGHAGVSGAKIGPSDFETEGHVPFSVTRDVLTFLGHYHKPQQVPGTRTSYLGSPLQLSWGESGEMKSFTLVDRGGSWTKTVPLNAFPRFVQVTPQELASVRPNDFVRVIASDDAEAAKVREVVRKERPAQEVTVGVTPVSPVRVEKPLGASVKEQIDAWLASRDLPENITRKRAREAAERLLAD